MKYLISIFFIFSISFSFAQTTGVPDTVAYLRDSIQGRRTEYINQPLTKLFNDLKIGITMSSSGVTYKAGLPDTVNVGYTVFEFYSVKRTALSPVTLPYIRVKYSQTLRIPKRLFKPGNTLGWIDKWNINQKLFYKDYIIEDLQVYGLP